MKPPLILIKPMTEALESVWQLVAPDEANGKDENKEKNKKEGNNHKNGNSGIQVEDFELYEVENIAEAAQILPTVGSSLTILSSPKKCGQLLQSSGNYIRKSNSKLLLISQKKIPQRILDKMIKLGLTECLVEPIVARSVVYKMNLHLKNVRVVMKDPDQEEEKDEYVTFQSEESEIFQKTDEKQRVEKGIIADEDGTLNKDQQDIGSMIDFSHIEEASTQDMKESTTIDLDLEHGESETDNKTLDLDIDEPEIDEKEHIEFDLGLKKKSNLKKFDLFEKEEDTVHLEPGSNPLFSQEKEDKGTPTKTPLFDIREKEKKTKEKTLDFEEEDKPQKNGDTPLETIDYNEMREKRRESLLEKKEDRKARNLDIKSKESKKIREENEISLDLGLKKKKTKKHDFVNKEEDEAVLPTSEELIRKKEKEEKRKDVPSPLEEEVKEISRELKIKEKKKLKPIKEALLPDEEEAKKRSSYEEAPEENREKNKKEFEELSFEDLYKRTKAEKDRPLGDDKLKKEKRLDLGVTKKKKNSKSKELAQENRKKEETLDLKIKKKKKKEVEKSSKVKPEQEELENFDAQELPTEEELEINSKDVEEITIDLKPQKKTTLKIKKKKKKEAPPEDKNEEDKKEKKKIQEQVIPMLGKEARGSQTIDYRELFQSFSEEPELNESVEEELEEILVKNKKKREQEEEEYGDAFIVELDNIEHAVNILDLYNNREEVEVIQKYLEDALREKYEAKFLTLLWDEREERYFNAKFYNDDIRESIENNEYRQIRYPKWSDETFQAPKLTLYHPFYDGEEHLGIGIIDIDKEKLESNDIRPFEALLETQRGIIWKMLQVNIPEEAPKEVEDTNKSKGLVKGLLGAAKKKVKGFFSKLFGKGD